MLPGSDCASRTPCSLVSMPTCSSGQTPQLVANATGLPPLCCDQYECGTAAPVGADCASRPPCPAPPTCSATKTLSIITQATDTPQGSCCNVYACTDMPLIGSTCASRGPCPPAPACGADEMSMVVHQASVRSLRVSFCLFLPDMDSSFLFLFFVYLLRCCLFFLGHCA